jgi:hypothetical protein
VLPDLLNIVARQIEDGAILQFARRRFPSAANHHGEKAEIKKVRPAPGGEPAAREPGLGTGRGGDVTEFA